MRLKYIVTTNINKFVALFWSRSTLRVIKVIAGFEFSFMKKSRTHGRMVNCDIIYWEFVVKKCGRHMGIVCEYFFSVFVHITRNRKCR